MNRTTGFCLSGLVRRSLLAAGAGALLASPAWAHSLRGTLGTAPDAVAQYTLDCYPVGGYATEGFVFSINARTRNRPYTLKAVVSKGNATVEATDPANGDLKPGLTRILNGRDGTYLVSVVKVPSGAKPAKGNMVFDFEHHCQAANGFHTGTTTPTKVQMKAAGLHAFSGTIGAGSAAVARYRVICAPEAGRATARYGFRVKAESKNRNFGVKLAVAKDGLTAETIDYLSGDSADSGGWTYLEAGDGSYDLTLGKIAEAGGPTKGKMVFKVENTCESVEAGLNSAISLPIKR